MTQIKFRLGARDSQSMCWFWDWFG